MGYDVSFADVITFTSLAQYSVASAVADRQRINAQKTVKQKNISRYNKLYAYTKTILKYNEMRYLRYRWSKK